MDKTNVMRLLDKAKIPYKERVYDPHLLDGEKIANQLGEDLDRVFKTLITMGNNHEYYVFCVPVSATLNLKKAAKSVGLKSIEMIAQKALLPLTGYIHGGCSPIGMKKKLKTMISNHALHFHSLFISGGRVGYQIEIDPIDLKTYINAEFVDIIDLE